uniref:SURP motif domain-containing protein n=1 Tax=Neobodo designis TaxID=312471 RepID=A0A7S1MK71_NEODS|mmetsp:Transcript_4202/g.13402  ORF Transcript_4202/g.13402 Transcript_4202/m.13402 type:complete len:124 (+) Transcript_4202:34-405(+)|eukprot:CAMPEP_0174852790 /NCGR_PEP_ID=MMETSP1114-20130205/26800_1 /TAXON_ID=312471 /ORGANISM="Neobodo designis, Strain CCAP 1951/1" /LENGTH=123 /DNA_ID=CAMNT_0016087407 /DNA_START=34 /DNA_END=405 /DNA_ORIENTATION=+
MFQVPPPPPPQGGPSEDAAPMLTPDDEERIRIVAARVAGSRHPGKFQMELTERTRYNHHFLFLDPAHPHHGLYQQLLAHFRHFSPEQWQQHRRAEADAVRLEREKRAENAAATSLLGANGRQS